MNFIQQYYLKRRLNSFVEKRTETQRSIYTLKETQSMCFFLTYDTFEQLEELIHYTSLHKKRKIICYLPSDKFIEHKIDTMTVYTITPKAIHLTGKVDKEVRENIFSQHYDVFIDTDIKSDLSALYLKTFFDADFRIGRNSEYYKYYDLTLCVGEQYTIKEYISNLETYTLKLKGN
ncbi:MAG: hypothetical protein LBG80_04090 [Bacteroidales bacterium]|jgi:hypothetical protein|nr:hypothetical protein [Bacteroidales bacterium]